MKTLSLDDSARVWVHVSNRRMTREEAHAVQQHLDQFMSGWQAHGALLSAQAVVVHGWIVALAVDERAQQATGCSIDASVSVLKRIGELQASMADLDLFDNDYTGSLPTQFGRMGHLSSSFDVSSSGLSGSLPTQVCL